MNEILSLVIIVAVFTLMPWAIIKVLRIEGISQTDKIHNKSATDGVWGIIRRKR